MASHPSFETEKFSSILLFGLPGSGKGVIGKLLSSAGSQFHLSSGDIFYPDPFSNELSLSDEVAVNIWKNHVEGLIANNSYHPDRQDLLLEGLPRTLGQAELLQQLINVRHIIVLEISDQNELIDRLRKRGKSSEDMSDEEMRHYLDQYARQMESVLSFYSHHIISKVDASQKPLEVIRDVLVRLSHLLSRTPKKTG